MSVTKFGTAAVVAAAAALPATAGWAFASAAVAIVLIAVVGFLVALQRFTRASGAVRKGSDRARRQHCHCCSQQGWATLQAMP